MTALRSIAHYSIEHELGRGGMGVVYRAIDTRLGRAVAIKSLPAAFADDVLWRTRFEAEARTLAAINHPNIAAIYGLEKDDTGAYLVLELAEGPTLAERIHAAPPTVAEALELTRQIALGLGVAHAGDIIHRDLKPANVKVRPDGVVKVLDFGIAKSGRTNDAVDPLAATLVQKVNHASSVPAFLLGTPGYMSPEQARGGVITPATDVWALGCVLFETLAHQMAFGGETLADSIALTLLGEPDYTALPRQTPGRVLRLIQACLLKKAPARPAGMAEVTAVLEDALRSLSVGRVFMAGGSTLAPNDDGPADPGNTPPTDRPLIGRDALVQHALESLESWRVVTLTGGPGSGLTSVAQAAGSRAAAAFRAGAWWVQLPAHADAPLQAALAAFSLSVRGRGGGVLPELIERIGARRLLLILDGVPAAGAPGTFLLDLLTACPQLRVLATARSPLHAPGELVVPIPPLGGPTETPSHLDPVRLFLETLAPVDAAVWKDRAAETQRLCALLKGNPLAIVLASGLAAAIAPQHFEAQLRQRAQLAAQADLESATPDRLVQVLTAWALDVQPVANLAVLLRAALFAGPWSPRALRAVGGAPDAMPNAPQPALPTYPEVRIADQLDRLIRAGLVRRTLRTDDPTLPCYTLPDAVRREATQRLSATPGAAALVHSGYLAFVHSLASLAQEPLAAPAASQLVAYYAELANATAHGADRQAIDPARHAVLRHFGLA